MENPMTWTECQKRIAFHMSSVGEGIAQNVVNGLIKDGFIASERYIDALITVVDGLKEHDRQMKSRICGLSSISIIYHGLKNDGLLL